MNFEPGTIAVGIAMILFYLRMAQIRGRKRKLARQEELNRLKSQKKRKETAPVNRPTYEVFSWWLVGGGAVLMLAGLAILTATGAPLSDYRPYWWVITTVGVLVFTFSFK